MRITYHTVLFSLLIGLITPLHAMEQDPVNDPENAHNDDRGYDALAKFAIIGAIVAGIELATLEQIHTTKIVDTLPSPNSFPHCIEDPIIHCNPDTYLKNPHCCRYYGYGPYDNYVQDKWERICIIGQKPGFFGRIFNRIRGISYEQEEKEFQDLLNNFNEKNDEN